MGIKRNIEGEKTIKIVSTKRCRGVVVNLSSLEPGEIMSGKDYFSSGSELKILGSASPWVHGEMEPYSLVNV